LYYLCVCILIFLGVNPFGLFNYYIYAYGLPILSKTNI